MIHPTRTFAILFCSLLLFPIITFSQTFEWAISAGGEINNDFVHSISLDDYENVFSTGFFQGTADFDPGGDELVLSATYRSTFIQKVDNDGNLIWAKSITGVLSNSGNSIAVDSEGNSIVAGAFQGETDFDPGVGTEEILSWGMNDGYVLKLDDAGNFVWAKQLGGVGNDIIYDVAVDADNNIISVGTFEGEVDFDPGAGEYLLSSSGGLDFFIQKLDSDGNFLWARKIGGGEMDLANSVCIDDMGNCFVTGFFNEMVDFDPGAGELMLSTDAETPFVLKLNASGELDWAVATQGTGNGRGYAIAIDNSDNVVLTGHFSGNVDFDPGAGVLELTAPIYYDAFVLKLNGDGEFIWAKAFGGNTSFDVGRDLAIDLLNDIWITGSFQTTADFDPEGDVFELESTGGRDVFIQRLNEDGGFVNANQMGGTSEDFGYAMTATDNAVFIGGYFTGTADFDFGAGVFEIESNGLSDAFLVKLSTCETETFITTETACGEYISSGGEVYTEGGLYQDTLTSAMGCDSVVVLDLTILNLDTTITQSDNFLTSNQAGVSYQWVDCWNDFEPIDGATDQTYEVTDDGGYAVIVSLGDCSDTSACFEYLHFSIAESDPVNFTVFPNPSNGEFMIDIDEVSANVSVRVYSSLGQIVYQNSFSDGPIYVKFEGEAGFYWLELITESGENRMVKILKSS